MLAQDKKRYETGKKQYPTELHPKSKDKERVKSAITRGTSTQHMHAIQTAKMRGNKGIELLEKYTKVLTKRFNSPRNPKFKKKYHHNMFGVWDDASMLNKDNYNQG